MLLNLATERMNRTVEYQGGTSQMKSYMGGEKTGITASVLL